MNSIGATFIAAAVTLGGSGAAAARAEDVASATSIRAFENAALFFAPDSTKFFANRRYGTEDNGRTATSTITFPKLRGPHRIKARVTVNPVPKDDRNVFDPWDRAGNLGLVTPGQPDLEIVRFMTPYGGATTYEVDVSHLGPLLRGKRPLKIFIDTWVHPAWKADVTFIAAPDTAYSPPTWVEPILYEQEFSRENLGDGNLVIVMVQIPEGLSRVVMKYLSTGHCTDGRDEDEFVSKANVISVDGTVVERFHPWREDCRENRAINPYCKRWTDGSWSSDYSRSGWCPGREALPVEIDLSDHLTAGQHLIRFVIEDIRPKDESGQFGYWRVSAYLVGWERLPRLWRNP